MANNVFVTKEEFQPIQENEEVKVNTSDIYTEVVSSSNNENRHDISRYKKISDTEYVDMETGEIIEHTSPNPSCKSISMVKESYKLLRRYIEHNFKGDITERFITLTYSECMTDLKQLSLDINNFLRKINRRYPKIIKYIYIKEPQERGSWHIHLLLKRLDGQAFVITKHELQKLWKHGKELDVQEIYDIDRLKWYFDITRYKEKRKRIIYYPYKSRIFEHSKNVTFETKKMKYKDSKNITQDKQCTYQEQLDISVLSNKGEFKTINTVKYEQYKKI